MAVKKDEKGKWYFYGVYPKWHPKHGKQYKRRGYKTKKEAVKAEIIFREEEKHPESYVTMSELIDEYLIIAKKRVKESTLRRYERLCRKYNDRFGSMIVSKIKLSDIQDYIDEMDAKNKKNSVANEVALLGSIIRMANEKGLSTINARLIRQDARKNEKQRNISFWEPEHFEKFIKGIDAPYYHLLFSVLYYMGCRIGEATALKWDDIDFGGKKMNIRKSMNERGEITTPKTKNSYRIISIPDNLMEEINNWKMIQEDFYSKSDMIFSPPCTRTTIARTFRKGIDKANERGYNIPVIRIHDLRHSHASYLINNMSAGFTDFDIAQRLGDTVSTLHSTYAHWFARADKNIVDFMNNQK